MAAPLINIDGGESPDEPVELYRLADVVNVACGGHAGDAESMRAVLSQLHGTRVSAHLSYPDRAHFGRVSMSLPDDELAASLRAQLHALDDAARELGHAVELIKLHGALYHDAARIPGLASLVVDVARQRPRTWAFIGPPAGALREAVLQQGWGYLVEGFADRRYRADGTLVPRTDAGALLVAPDAAAAQAVRLAAAVDTLCVHSDTPNAVVIARAVREALRTGSAGTGRLQ